jgi:hypothetical protein
MPEQFPGKPSALISLCVATACLLAACGGGGDAAESAATSTSDMAADSDRGTTGSSEPYLSEPNDPYPEMARLAAEALPPDAEATPMPESVVLDDTEERSMQAMTLTTTSVGTASVAWVAPKTRANGSTLGPLTGYRIYYGTTSGKYTSSMTVSSTALAGTVSGLAAGRWFFTVSTVDSYGNESNLGYELSKTL